MQFIADNDGVTLGCRPRTYNREVGVSTPGQIAIKWLLLGWVTVCGQVNHPGI